MATNVGSFGPLTSTGGTIRKRVQTSAALRVLLFATTIFLSAFLLFQVQPLTSKFILPWFGGSPAVWTAAMLFYQVMLFGGYLYAHLSSSYLSARGQLWTHLVLLLLGAILVLWLRITPPGWMRPIGSEQASPLAQILLLLGLTVGLPYFALSATGPLLQKWFGESFPERSPYRLFALSNFGSLLALLSYPFFVEVYWGSNTQSLVWSSGFMLFGVACACCAYFACSGRAAKARSSPADGAVQARQPQHATVVGWQDWAMWLYLPALASLMLLAVTNEVCQNVTTVPLLWIVPLSLYLVTFIIAFDHPRWYYRPFFLSASLVLLVMIGMYDQLFGWIDDLLNRMFSPDETAAFELADAWGLEAAVHFLGFFLVAMVCHGELARRKPSREHLTTYYLTMSLGGAVGGILVNLVAPFLFTSYFEFPLGLVISTLTVLLLTVAAQWDRGLAAAIGGLPTRIGLRPQGSKLSVRWLAIAAAVAALLLVTKWRIVDDAWAASSDWNRTHHESRSFFGVVSVDQRAIGDPDENFTFFSGHIQHGKQLADPQRRHVPLTYYGEGSGIALAIQHVQRTPGPAHIGVVGLGVGTLATYSRPGDKVRFYEINPQVVKIANNTDWFHFLNDCRGDVEIVLGDARLQLERELSAAGSHQFDVLCIDAFSGDAIPSHLITDEAFGVYRQHLKPGGILALHITNTYLDLYPVAKQLCEHHGLGHTRIYQEGDHDRMLYRNYYVLASNDEEFLAATPEQISTLPEYLARERSTPLWTDSYHNLWSLLR